MESKQKKLKFRIIDIILLILMILPLVAGMTLRVLTTPASDGIVISGARIYFTIPTPFQDLPITESQVNSWLVILSIFWLCLFFVHGIKEKPQTRRQYIAEWVVEKTEAMVKEYMGDYFGGFAPFIAAILLLSAFSSLMTLVGLYPPTSDLNVVAGWAIVVFILITYYKCKCGLLCYLKSYCDPVPLLAPLNVISEIATPISMAFRHYGNILSGTVISVLITAGLQGLSSLVFGWLPFGIGKFPFLQIGLPAVLSLYFDIFSGCLQAFIFAMLTMLYVSGGFPQDEYEKRKVQRRLKREAKLAQK